MSHEAEIPDGYYENPWLPSETEADEWGSLPLTPKEAFYIMVKKTGEGTLSEKDGRILREIYNGETTQDFLELRDSFEDED